MKTCSRCKKTKELDGFVRNKQSKDGRTATCRVCTLELQQWRRNAKVKAEAEKRRRETAHPSDGIPWPPTLNI